MATDFGLQLHSYFLTPAVTTVLKPGQPSAPPTLINQDLDGVFSLKQYTFLDFICLTTQPVAVRLPSLASDRPHPPLEVILEVLHS